MDLIVMAFCVPITYFLLDPGCHFNSLSSLVIIVNPLLAFCITFGFYFSIAAFYAPFSLSILLFLSPPSKYGNDNNPKDNNRHVYAFCLFT